LERVVALVDDLPSVVLAYDYSVLHTCHLVVYELIEYLDIKPRDGHVPEHVEFIVRVSKIVLSACASMAFCVTLKAATEEFEGSL
jgi:hypothetical protein